MLKTSTFMTITKIFAVFYFLPREVQSECLPNLELAKLYTGLFLPKDLKSRPYYLGEGAAGVVVKGSWLDQSNPTGGYAVAIKQSKTADAIETTMDEEFILASLNKAGLEHIPKLYACFLDENDLLYLLTGYLQTSLTIIDPFTGDNSRAHKKFFDEGTVLQRLTFYRKLAVALNELYVNSYFHGDLKPDNIMLDGRPEEIFDKDVVLIDFGATRPLDFTELSGGSPAYMDYEAELRYCYDNEPEELLQNMAESKISETYQEAWKVDIWALAVIIYEYENSRRFGMPCDPLDFMAAKIDCRYIEQNSNAKRLRTAVLKDAWLKRRGLDFKINGQPQFKDLLDDMTKVMRSDRLITMTDVVQRLTDMIGSYPPAPQKQVRLLA